MPIGKYKYKRENLYTVIVVYDGPNGQPAFAKYRNIDCDKPATWERTKRFFEKKFPTAKHANIYGGISREYKKQVKLGGPA
jgi:hypothetical protein